MTDPLEQLKQQLYTKIQATCKPEEPPSDVERLKNSQLPEYQAHQRLKQHTQQQWKQAPMQGAIPSPVKPLSSVEESLKGALPWLEQAYCLMNGNHLDERYTELYVAICDAMTAVQEACDRINDAPDTPGAPYDVVIHQGQPIKGQTHTPKAAFDQ